MISLYESIVSSNKAGVMSLDVFNKKIREVFEKTFKSFIHLNKKTMHPPGVSWHRLGWPIQKSKYKRNTDEQLIRLLEKFTKELSVYKPEILRHFQTTPTGGSYEILFMKHPEEWYEIPSFEFSTIYTEDHKYWLLLDYDDEGIDDIFNPENT